MSVRMKPDNLVRKYITPEIAKSMLDGKATNRRINDRKVEQYAGDMAVGRYDFDAISPIRVNTKGVLTDGQHRLTAIVRSGVSAWMWIETTDSSSFDLGVSRTGANLLDFAGYQNTKCIESTARVILNVKRMRESGLTMGANNRRNSGIGAREIADSVMGDLSFITEIVPMGMKIYSSQARFGRVFGQSACSALLWFCWEDRNDLDLGISIMEPIASGEGIVAGDPRLAYRKFAASLPARVRTEIEFPALMYVARCVISKKPLNLIRSSAIGDISKL